MWVVNDKSTLEKWRYVSRIYPVAWYHVLYYVENFEEKSQNLVFGFYDAVCCCTK